MRNGKSASHFQIIAITVFAECRPPALVAQQADERLALFGIVFHRFGPWGWGCSEQPCKVELKPQNASARYDLGDPLVSDRIERDHLVQASFIEAAVELHIDDVQPD